MCDMNKRLQTFLCLLFLVAPVAVRAQGTQADYTRAQNLRKLTANKVFKTKIDPSWFANNTRFWYRNNLSGGAREFIIIDAAKGTRPVAWRNTALIKAGTYEDEAETVEPVSTVVDKSAPTVKRDISTTGIHNRADKPDHHEPNPTTDDRFEDVDLSLASFVKPKKKREELPDIGKPEPGKQYSLSGIANGKSWAESAFLMAS